MKPLLPKPVTPPVSPLAEVVLAFAESDPDACALLQPFAEALSRDELEVRARRNFSHLSSSDREVLVDRAAELLELGQQGGDVLESPVPERRTTTGTSPEQRERLRGILEAALVEDPALSPRRGAELLSEHSGVSVPAGTFHGSYWRPVIASLPASVRALREEMTARRPTTGKLDPTDRQRTEARQIVAILKRDHPDWHSAQMMDEVRRRTGVPFGDPVSFKRYYVDPVAPARSRSGKSRPVNAPTLAQVPHPVQATPPPVQPSLTAAADAPPIVDPVQRADRSGSGAVPLLVSADRLNPAQLTEAGDGQVRVQLNFRSMSLGEAYRMMGIVYTEIARHLEAGVESAP